MVVTPGNARPHSTRLARLVLVAGLVGFAGCVPEDAGYEVDPMLGGTPIPQNKATAPPPSVVSGNNLPALPAAGGTVSPAAIAGGTDPALAPASDPSYNLRIAAPSNPDANWHNQPTASGTQPQPPDPLMGLSNPATIPVKVQLATTTTANTLPITNPPAGPARIDTYQQAQEQLAARGVVGQQLLQIGENGVWEFRCSVPVPGNPSIHNVYKVQAPGENGVAAIRLVIQKIDADHQP